MSEPSIIFWILAAVTLISGALVVTLKNIFHCALFLILCLFCVAGIYILLEAEFLAAAQVLIYVGAVAILIIFAVMLTTDLAKNRVKMVSEDTPIALIASGIFAFGAIMLIWYTVPKIKTWVDPSNVPMMEDNIASIGKYLMTQFMLPFEVVSVLLLAALIGAIVLARKERS